MNKIIVILALAMILVIPAVFATDVGSGIGITVTTQKFAPQVWLCQDRVVNDDCTENGLNDQQKTCSTDLDLTERKHNYAFEGESIYWQVLVVDKNKIEDVQDVIGTIGQSQGAGNDVEVECKRTTNTVDPYTDCKAMIYEEHLKWNSDIMAVYDCRLTVETPASMHGEYFLTVEAKDAEGLSGTMAENEFWFLNPTIALSVDGNLAFEDVMPGTQAYSNTILVGNDAEAGSGVILDMFISGTDFYDPTSSGARCSDNTNKLALREFSYFVTNGAYDSLKLKNTNGVDNNGYTPIPYSTEISGSKKIMRFDDLVRGAAPSSTVEDGDWNKGNALSPGSEMALTFKLNMPEPCIGDFSEGQIYFWGEAI